MKRILMTDETHGSLVAALADLEILLIMQGESTEEVNRLRAVIKNAEAVNEIPAGK